MTLKKSDTNFAVEPTCKLTWEIRQILSGALESIFLMGCLWANCILFVLKNYRWVIFHDTEKYAKFWGKLTCCFKIDIRNLTNFENQVLKSLKLWCKLWRKTYLWFVKRQVEFGKFSSQHLRVSILRLWLDSFMRSRKCINLKFTEELYVEL